MKKLIFLSTAFFIWSGCQTSPKLPQNNFEPFTIQKLTEKGIQEVHVRSSGRDWPELKQGELKPSSYKTKNLKIAIMGDTGCRLKESKVGNRYQDCSDLGEWPYPEVVKTIAKDQYDFAIHTGDYHYREQCTDEKICPKITQSVGYGWAPWWDDFYGPSQALFAKSPILFIRGNHEDCQRAFSGWSPLASIPKRFDEKCEVVEPYQWIEIEDLVLINFDDSAFDDRKEITSEQFQKWVQAFKILAERVSVAKKNKEIWFIAHRPILGFIPNKEDAEPVPISDKLKQALSEAGMLSLVDYYLSGHVHSQQVVTTEKQAVQVIVGHTGTGLEPFGRKIMNQNVITTTESKRSFGYAIFERLGHKKWKWQFKNIGGQSELDCQVTGAKVNCDFVN